MVITSLHDKKLMSGCYIPRAKAYYFKTWQGYEMIKMHSHDQVEIMYIVQGSCSITTDREELTLLKGDFIILDAGILHKLSMPSNSSCRMLNIEFVFEMSKETLCSLSILADRVNSLKKMLQNSFDYIVLKDYEELLYTLKELILEHDMPGRNNSCVKELLFSQILIKISALWEEKHVRPENQGIVYVREAIRYIHQHYDSNISINDISKYLNINRSYLQRLFKSSTGCTIINYITNIRIDKSKSLLSDTNIPIIDISNYIGINSRQYFTYLFSKHCGISPSEYRRNSQISSYSLPK